ncbi:hypothetical protein HUJ04_010232 [Dendroctonus ponderosae]|uniref:Uncharacterized protein n=1 Tax=Dendroctonus ponderosae TaxID=77166 RepID=A0AAR5P8X4_DENPD|nr:hypothetical protein HUJ04_010232 [Dendroctonus ponderosae]
MAQDQSKRHSGGFDPLARLGEITRLSQSTPSSPRLLPRRTRGITGVSAHASASGLVPRPDSVHTFESGSSDATVGEVDWKQRCLELQLELHRTKAQSTRTRDMLRDKVSHFQVNLLIVL